MQSNTFQFSLKSKILIRLGKNWCEALEERMVMRRPEHKDGQNYDKKKKKDGQKFIDHLQENDGVKSVKIRSKHEQVVDSAE